MDNIERELSEAGIDMTDACRRLRAMVTAARNQRAVNAVPGSCNPPIQCERLYQGKVWIYGVDSENRVFTLHGGQWCFWGTLDQLDLDELQQISGHSTDSEGKPIPADEPNDAWIAVWEVSPHPQGNDYDIYWERSYQGMLQYIRDHLEELLERHFDMYGCESDPLTITFRLREMRKAEYLEIITTGD